MYLNAKINHSVNIHSSKIYLETFIEYNVYKYVINNKNKIELEYFYIRKEVISSCSE